MAACTLSPQTWRPWAKAAASRRTLWTGTLGAVTQYAVLLLGTVPHTGGELQGKKGFPMPKKGTAWEAHPQRIGRYEPCLHRGRNFQQRKPARFFWGMFSKYKRKRIYSWSRGSFLIGYSREQRSSWFCQGFCRSPFLLALLSSGPWRALSGSLLFPCAGQEETQL